MMPEITDLSDSDCSLEVKREPGVTPKPDLLGYNDDPYDGMYLKNMGDNVASSSGTNIRCSLLGMGFHPSLVDKAIRQNGEENVDSLLETLFAYSAVQNSKPGIPNPADSALSDKNDELAGGIHRFETIRKSDSSSDSLESLFGDEDDINRKAKYPEVINIKEDPDECCDVTEDKKASLLLMNFTLDEIEFAVDKLGKDAPVNEMVDFIFALQIASGKDPNQGQEVKNEDDNTETLFGTMEKTLRLLEVGFTEQEISAAFEKYGSEVPLSELADSIVADRTAVTCIKQEQGLDPSFYSKLAMKTALREAMEAENEAHGQNGDSFSRDYDLMEHYNGKRPKEEYSDEPTMWKKPKQEYDDDLNSISGPAFPAAQGMSKYLQRRLNHKLKQKDRPPVPKLSKPSSSRSVDQMVAKAPLFFYGNVLNLSDDAWMKISQFLYAIEPEFVNTQYFSALSRKEGYIHNLPTENRFHVLPKPPMTIDEAIPFTKRYWPSWDTRKQLTCICSEVVGNSLYDRLGKVLRDSKGFLSSEKQKEVLHHCRTMNLMWVGHNKLAQIEPEYLEHILGYPRNYTRAEGFSLAERLHTLKHCFQTDTLGYHLSVLKPMFPQGLTMLSIYSGVGGAEITLHRLGIKLKGVVSIEPSETKRKILKQWWENSEQTGVLEQVDDVQKLSSKKIDSLVQKFGGFDFIVCQNPYPYSSKSSGMAADAEPPVGLDFSLFYEFVRVLQRVRSAIAAK